MRGTNYSDATVCSAYWTHEVYRGGKRVWSSRWYRLFFHGHLPLNKDDVITCGGTAYPAMHPNIYNEMNKYKNSEILKLTL